VTTTAERPVEGELPELGGATALAGLRGDGTIDDDRFYQLIRQDDPTADHGRDHLLRAPAPRPISSPSAG
jgi:hypothetical protein